MGWNCGGGGDAVGKRGGEAGDPSDIDWWIMLKHFHARREIAFDEITADVEHARHAESKEALFA